LQAAFYSLPSPAPGQGKVGKKMRIVFFAAHPTDLEASCGGLMTLLAKDGHEVIAACATTARGNRKLKGSDQLESVVRRQEEETSCKIMGVKPHFFGYDMDTLAPDAATLKAVASWIKETKPDIMLTHWPVDEHENHNAASGIAWQCFLQQGKWGLGKWNLYFFETMTPSQTKGFRPELFVNIEPVLDVKRKAVDAHVSSNPPHVWKMHDPLMRNRGIECGVTYAEGYLLPYPRPGAATLPVSLLPRKN